MKVTFIIRDVGDDFFNGIPHLPSFGPGLLNMEPIKAFEKLENLASTGDKRIAMRVGSANAFRDRVDLNQLRRSQKPPAFKLEPRKGYRLATYEFS